MWLTRVFATGSKSVRQLSCGVMLDASPPAGKIRWSVAGFCKLRSVSAIAGKPAAASIPAPSKASLRVMGMVFPFAKKN
jgi:hypothetical protein